MAGNFDTSGTQSSRTKITTSPRLWACSVVMRFTLKDTVKSIVNEMPLHNKSQSNLFVSLNVHTWADFSLHLFIFLLSFSTRIMSETAWWSQCVGTACSHIRITAGLPTVQQRPVSAKTLGQFSLWWSVGDSSYFHTVIVSHFPTWLELKSQSSSDRAGINLQAH